MRWPLSHLFPSFLLAHSLSFKLHERSSSVVLSLGGCTSPGLTAGSLTGIAVTKRWGTQGHVAGTEHPLQCSEHKGGKPMICQISN